MKKSIGLGIVLVLAGIFLMIENTIGINEQQWNLVWPIFVLLCGVYMEIAFFIKNSNSKNIFLAGLLLVYGTYFTAKYTFGFSAIDNAAYIYTFGIAFGFFERYLFVKKANSDLILTAIFTIMSLYLFIKIAFPEIKNINEFVFPSILIILGFYILFKNIKQKNI